MPSIEERRMYMDDEFNSFSNLGPLPLDFKTITRNYSMADYTYEVIMERIKDFEDKLDYDHEVSIQLASFGKSITLAVSEIGYSNPTTLVFHGIVDGNQRATLIQHVSQLNFLLVAVKKSDPEKPPRRIGFVPPNEA